MLLASSTLILAPDATRSTAHDSFHHNDHDHEHAAADAAAQPPLPPHLQRGRVRGRHGIPLHGGHLSERPALVRRRHHQRRLCAHRSALLAAVSNDMTLVHGNLTYWKICGSCRLLPLIVQNLMRGKPLTRKKNTTFLILPTKLCRNELLKCPSCKNVLSERPFYYSTVYFL